MQIVSNIQNTQNYLKPFFRGNENNWNVFGIDEGGKSAREYIRKWHEEYSMPYQSIYEKEGAKSEYEQKNIIANLTKRTEVDNNKLNKIGLYNLERLGNTNSYRGAMIKGYETDKLKMLKDAGIRAIASLMNDPSLEKACTQHNIDYIYLDLDTKSPCLQAEQEIKQKSESFWRNIAKIKDEKLLEDYVKKDIDIWKEKSQLSIDKLTEFIKFMKKDNVYIGCACGTIRTDFGVMLNLLFNPLVDYTCNICNTFDNLKAFENLYHNLTTEKKLKMGWTKSFEEIFLSNLNKYKI